LVEEVKAFVVQSEEDLDTYRRKFTNKKAVINDLIVAFRALPGSEKATVGKPLIELNDLA
ncbi:MAG: phenylalanine--tRNA ligase subunit alpha, partial [Bacteroidota bacterium]